MCGDACWLGGATGHSPRPETARRGCKMDWDGPAVSPLGGRKSALSAPGRPPLDERTSANSTHPTRLRLRFGHTGAAHYAQRDNVVPSAVAAAREVPADCCSTRTHCVHLGVSMPKFRPEGGHGRRAEQLYVAQLTFGLSRTTTTTSLPAHRCGQWASSKLSLDVWHRPWPHHYGVLLLYSTMGCLSPIHCSQTLLHMPFQRVSALSLRCVCLNSENELPIPTSRTSVCCCTLLFIMATTTTMLCGITLCMY